jgi:hypothetical protein
MSSRVRAMFILLLVAYLCTFLGHCSVVTSLDGEPSYSLMLTTSNTQLSSGDNFTIEIRISGMGDVNVSKIVFSIPQYIPNDKIVTLMMMNFTPINDNPSNIHTEPIILTRPPGFWILIPNVIYDLILIDETATFYGDKLSGASPLTLGESIAPYMIHFKIADDAPPGDHDISIIYCYKDNNQKWYQDKQTIKIHIKRFYENAWFQVIASVATILGLFVLIFEAGSRIKKLKELATKFFLSAP